MKSKKAQEAIKRYRQAFTDGFVTQNEIERVKEHCRLFTEVVEIAESERDAKAVEAFCNTVCGGINLDCEKCTLRPAFIQKLNEE